MHKCCILNCTSSKSEVHLHAFPRSEKRFRRWLMSINDPALIQLNKNRIISGRRVCHKHFETKFIRQTLTNGIHFSLTPNAYPSLFSEQEIESGRPSTNETGNSINLVLQDHTYHLDADLDISKCLGLQSEELNSSVSGCVAEQVSENDSEAVQSQTGRVAGQMPEHDSQSDKRQTEHENIELENDIFSWEEKNEPQCIHEDEAEHTEDVACDLSMYCDEVDHEAEHTEVVPCDLSMYCDDEAAPVTTKQVDCTGRHEGFHCDNCNGDIVGYRYTCVQCSDLDLCVTCESRGAHSHHYMLRVPSPRPYNEIQTVLARIRMHLMKQLDPISGPDLDNDDKVSVKSEVKSEDETEDAEDIEQVDTLAEETVTSKAEEHSRLSSAASQHSEQSDSTIVFENEEVLQETEETLKGKTQNLIRISLPDNIETTLLSTAKRKILEEVSGPVETIGFNQQTKWICYQPSKQVKSIVWDSNALVESSRVTFVKLPPGALLKRGETVSLQIRPPKDPLTNAPDSMS